jgi:hypothetical protein
MGVPVDAVAIGFGALAGGLGALMPDIDHPQSTASRSLPRKFLAQGVEMVVPLVAILLLFGGLGSSSAGASMFAAFAPALKFAGALLAAGIALLVLSAGVRMFTQHRGATHSLAFAGGATILACVACLVFSVPAWYGLLFGWGWLTHLAADATTNMGLPSLYWPFESLQVGTSPGPLQRPMLLTRPTAAARVQPPTTNQPPGASVMEHAVPIQIGAPRVALLRTAKRGRQPGRQFYGCANYPRCRQTRSYP